MVFYICRIAVPSAVWCSEIRGEELLAYGPGQFISTPNSTNKKAWLISARISASLTAQRP